MLIHEKLLIVQNKDSIRICSMILVVLSIAELVVGTITFTYVANYKYGTWWAAIVPFISGCLGMLLLSMHFLRAMTILGYFGFVTSIIGFILDILSLQTINSLTTCYSTQSNAIYGDHTLVGQTLDCAFSNHGEFHANQDSVITKTNYCDCIYSSKTCLDGTAMGCNSIHSNGLYFSCHSTFQLTYTDSLCYELMPDGYYSNILFASIGLNISISAILAVVLSICTYQIVVRDFCDNSTKTSRLPDGSTAVYELVSTNIPDDATDGEKL